MELLWLALPGLACAAMLLFVCVPMMLGKRKGCATEAATKQEIDALREEIAALRNQARPFKETLPLVKGEKQQQPLQAASR